MCHSKWISCTIWCRNPTRVRFRSTTVYLLTHWPFGNVALWKVKSLNTRHKWRSWALLMTFVSCKYRRTPLTIRISNIESGLTIFRTAILTSVNTPEYHGLICRMNQRELITKINDCDQCYYCYDCVKPFSLGWSIKVHFQWFRWNLSRTKVRAFSRLEESKASSERCFLMLWFQGDSVMSNMANIT